VGAAWFPWCFALYLQALQKHTWVSIFLASISIFMVISTGGGYYPIYLLACLAVLFVIQCLRTIPDERLRQIRTSALVVSFSAALSAVVIIPYIDAYRYSGRDVLPDLVQYFSQPIQYGLMNYMIDTPEWFNASVLGTAGGWNWFYIGWLPVAALLIVPLAFSQSPRKRWPILLSGILFLILLMWFSNRFSPFKKVYDWIPFLYNLRFPNRLLIIATSPLLILSALALEHAYRLSKTWVKNLKLVYAPSGKRYRALAVHYLVTVLWILGLISTTKYVYDGKTNLLLQSTGPSAPPLGALTWNAAGQLATNLDGTKYQYDGLGRRVLKSPPGGAGIVYHYDVAGRLLAETSATTGAALREYFYLANQLVAVAGCISGNAPPCSEREWYHTDILGDVVARTNSSKAITVGLVYQAWGELPTAGMGIRGTRLYNGRTFDEFSAGGGFYDYAARIYSPELGRFLSADPAWSQQNDPQSSNLYAYTLNNPYKYTDPTGREPFALTQNWNLSGKPQRVVDAWEFIVNQRQVQSYWQQVLDEQMTVKEAKENMISTGNAYEGITDAGRTRSLLEQDVVTRVEKFEIFEEGTQLVRLGIAIARDIFGGGDSHIQKAIAQNEIERSNHAIRLAKLLIGLPPAGQICSACHDGDRIYDTPMYVPDK